MKKLVLALIVIALFRSRSAAQLAWSNTSPSGVSDGIWDVTYANGMFAAVTDQGRLLTSSDGTVWTAQVVDQGVWLVSIAYGNGEWVIVGDKGTILVSTDLKAWTSAKSVTANKLNGVHYNGAGWTAVGEAGTILASADGINWTVQAGTAPFTGFFHGIDSVPIDAATQNARWPSAGVTLIAGQGGTYDDLRSGPLTSSSNPLMLDYEAVVINTDDPNQAVLVGAGGIASQAGFFETDFNVFSSATLAPAVRYRGLAYGNGYYVAAGEQGAINTSTDGATWTQRFAGDSPATVTTATLLSATYSSPLHRFVITGLNGTILVSNSIPTAFGNVSTRGLVSPSQSFIGGFVIQGTAARTVLVRADGPVLANFSVPSPLKDPVLTVYDSKGNVVATNTAWGTNPNAAAITSAAIAVGAFAWTSGSADSALLLTLAPGAYTAVITSASNGSGAALFEAYTD